MGGLVSPGSLVLVRHGQSTTNAAGVFTGWLDVPLTVRGRVEAVRAGRVLATHSVTPDVVHTSTLARTVTTAGLVLAPLAGHPPVHPDGRLDERHYGALTGRSKQVVRQEVGRVRFDDWRNSLITAPPPLTGRGLRELTEAGWPTDRLLSTGVHAESLGDVVARVTPFWEQVLRPGLVTGRTVLVVAHGNSLRALLVVLDRLTQEELSALRLPTGVVLRYRFTDALRPLVRGGQLLGPTPVHDGGAVF